MLQDLRDRDLLDKSRFLHPFCDEKWMIVGTIARLALMMPVDNHISPGRDMCHLSSLFSCAQCSSKLHKVIILGGLQGL